MRQKGMYQILLKKVGYILYALQVVGRTGIWNNS